MATLSCPISPFGDFSVGEPHSSKKTTGKFRDASEFGTVLDGLPINSMGGSFHGELLVITRWCWPILKNTEALIFFEFLCSCPMNN